MNAVTISAATPDEIRSGDLGRRLRKFNHAFVGEYPEQHFIRLNARDAEGRVIGGVRAFVFLHWLQVEVLFVDEPLRRTGVGSALLAAAEQAGRDAAAKNALLETFEWQAPGFYARHGYRELSRIENYVGEYALVRMAKPL